MAGYVEFRVDNEAESVFICFYSTVNYRLADGTLLYIEQKAAWCNACQSFGTAEAIPSIDELHSRIAELKAPNQATYFVHGSDDGIREAIKETGVRLAWRETRQSLARCLTCGSADIVPVLFDQDQTCVIQGKKLILIGRGFADTEPWIAEFTSEGLALI